MSAPQSLCECRCECRSEEESDDVFEQFLRDLEGPRYVWEAAPDD